MPVGTAEEREVLEGREPEVASLREDQMSDVETGRVAEPVTLVMECAAVVLWLGVGYTRLLVDDVPGTPGPERGSTAEVPEVGLVVDTGTVTEPVTLVEEWTAVVLLLYPRLLVDDVPETLGPVRGSTAEVVDGLGVDTGRVADPVTLVEVS